MTTVTAGKPVDAGVARTLKRAYHMLVKAGHNSVRAAWRFGQTLDSFSDKHTGYAQARLAEATGLSTGTIYKYRRFYGLFQTPELAVQASEELETYDIGILIELHGQTAPVGHGRPLAGRHWRHSCRACGGTDIARLEIDADGNLVSADENEDEDDELVASP